MIFPVLLYACESWLFTPTEEHSNEDV